MVKENIAYGLLALVAIVAIGSFAWSISSNNAAGSYTATGGGRYIAGPTIIQLSPQDACQLAGCTAKIPAAVRRNEYGVYLAECDCPEGKRAIPLIQKVTV